MTVIGTAGYKSGLEPVEAQGAHHVLNHHSPGYLDKLSELTCGKGVAVVLEMLANVNLDKDLGVIGIGGRIVVIGSRGRIEIDPRTAMTKEATILGMTLFNTSEKESESMHAAFYAGPANATLRPVVSREIPLLHADDVRIEGDTGVFRLEALMEGEEIAPMRHRLLVDVKAVTMHLFRVERVDNLWRATVVLDI